MIDVRTAVESAAQYAKEWLGSSEVLLEEVEPSQKSGSDVWLVTLSIPRRYPPSGSALHASAAAALLYGNREFKVFEFDGQTGLVRSMRIREMART